MRRSTEHRCSKKHRCPLNVALVTTHEMVATDHAPQIPCVKWTTYYGGDVERARLVRKTVQQEEPQSWTLQDCLVDALILATAAFHHSANPMSLYSNLYFSKRQREEQPKDFLES